jgi:protein ImuB
LSLWLPRLSTDRLERLVVRNRRRSGAPPPEAWPPLLITTREAGAMRVAAVNATAAEAGLHPGLALAQAQAMCPAAIVRPHDPAADSALLERLADWLDRYTPFVGRTPPDGLMLDITGAAHLVGGEAPLLADIRARLTAQGLKVRLALAGTPGCAFALARAGISGTIVPSGAERQALASLPVAALRIDADMAASLARTGLKTIGDLMTRPRAPLSARFGPLLLHRLDQALGVDAEAITPRAPVPPAMVEQRFAEPIVRSEDVSTVARQLAVQLCADLQARGEGVRHLVLTVFRVDGARRQIDARVADACRDAAVLHSLLALRLGHLEDPLDPGYGFDMIRLAAPLTGPWSPEAQALPVDGVAHTQDPARAARRLADRLSARFGADNVLRIVASNTHVPETAARLAPASGQTPSLSREADLSSVAAAPDIGPLRPLRLFEPPEPVEVIAAVPDGPPLRLRWRRQSLRMVSAEGPERIAIPWWNASRGVGGFDPLPRDYYRVSDETGRRLWIFREGLYTAPDAASQNSPARPPRWFVHGLFG